MLRLLLILVMLGLALMAAAGVPRPQITRQQLGITPSEQQSCFTPALTFYGPVGVEAMATGNEYVAFAVAALDTYEEGAPEGFTLANHSPEWRRRGRVERASGLALDYYFRDAGDRLEALVAIRGSELYDTGDWSANLAWFTAWLPIRNQYDDARDVFMDIRREAYEQAAGRSVGFVVTGHSLGGGIAQHLAYAFPCTSAPIFNSSFVVLKYRLKEPYTGVPIVHIYEDLEPLTRFRRLLFVDRETEFYRHYRVQAVDMREFSHSLAGLAVGLVRRIVACQRAHAARPCPVPPEDSRARRLYCRAIGLKPDGCAAA